MKLKFHITHERIRDELNIAAQIALAAFGRGQEAELEDAIELMIPFLQNEAGVFLDDAEARRIIKRVKNKELKAVIATFSKALSDFLSVRATELPLAELSSTEGEAALTG